MCEQWIPGASLQYFSSAWEGGYVKVTYKGRLACQSTWEYLSLVFEDVHISNDLEGTHEFHRCIWQSYAPLFTQ